MISTLVLNTVRKSVLIDEKMERDGLYLLGEPSDTFIREVSEDYQDDKVIICEKRRNNDGSAALSTALTSSNERFHTSFIFYT